MARPRNARTTDPESTQAAGGVAGPGRFSYDGLDRVIHEKARLGILASLAAHGGGLLFNDLKELCSLTDGNLSRHLSVLSDAGLIETWKGQQGARPQTLYRLTVDGRQRFTEYISVLEDVVSDAHRKAAREAFRSSASWRPN
jgi:DNA-binding MarR family transcriptional regulator